MVDTRPVQDPTSAILAMQSDIAALQAGQIRATRGQTGDIEPTLLAAAKAQALLLNGQTVSRTTYPALWQWVQDNSLIVTNGFTVGDGSTTFGLPDFRGSVLRMCAASEAVFLRSGADTKTIVSGNLPSHTHAINGDGNHGHSYSTDGAGTHGGHFQASGPTNVPSGSFYGVAAWNDPGSSGGFHSHTGGTTNVADHTHGGVTGATGTGTAFDVRQASVNVNWMIWT